MVFNEAEKVELSPLNTEQLRAGVHNLGQIRRQQIFYDELTHKLLAASRLHLKMG